MLDVTPIPVLSDNYTWLLRAPKGSNAVIVDPGAAEPVAHTIAGLGLTLTAILVTHHHLDHVAGIEALANAEIPVYGPNDSRVPCLTHPLAAGDSCIPRGIEMEFEILAVPGHTLEHIAFFSHGLLFAGDALFAGGCGRMFEGTAAQMQNYLAELRELPPETKLYCGHEYTQANLAFASAVEPNNQALQQRIETVSSQRQKGGITLPSTLAEERETNPFLRWDEPEVIAQASQHAGRKLNSPVEVFAVLRDWKDHF
ncbi:MAG: hydroxyacylglutathione hydrolase [Spiribacter sp.]|jgi:hydroxyacylglutathione hydrolase|nr:hydroxyacylglutathione hydrolase [Spiribacter sp.]MDR9488978.1 hydroxyacylglutathione hydrolase [Spiribacter sp.]